VVRCLGVIQTQDYLGALWAIGLRMMNALEADIEQVIMDKTILHTWLLWVHYILLLQKMSDG
jgi:hypothetical protein